MAEEKIEVTLEAQLCGNPSIVVCTVVAKYKGKEGRVTFGSREQAETFLKGATAALNLVGVQTTEVPRVPTVMDLIGREMQT